MSILAAEAGTFTTATGLYAAHDGEWVEVPLGGGGEWTRPADWLATSVGVGEQKVQCLLALGADPTVEGNRIVTVQTTVSSGLAVVDWGDGTAPQNVPSGSVGYHLYDPAALAGTMTSEGFLQALVTVTPQGAANMTSLTFSQLYATGKTYRSPVIEIVVGSSVLATLALGGFTPLLRRVEFKQPFTPLAPASLFANCYGLREIVGELVLTGANLTSVFSNCTNLNTFPTLTVTGTGINATSMFTGCNSMVEPPPFQTSGVLIWATTFANCFALRRLFPGFSISPNATQLASTFLTCPVLGEVPLLNSDSVTTFSAAFQGCPSLRSVSFTSTASATVVSNMFNACASLESLTGLDFSTVTSAANIATTFAGCLRLCELEFLPGKGPRFSFTITGQPDAAQLNAIYTALPVVTGQTITVTSALGTVGDDPTIATAKGWTVTGS